MDDLARFAQMMQSMGQGGNNTSPNFSQNQGNGNGGQTQFDPSLLASLFGGQNNPQGNQNNSQGTQNGFQNNPLSMLMAMQGMNGGGGGNNSQNNLMNMLMGMQNTGGAGGGNNPQNNLMNMLMGMQNTNNFGANGQNNQGQNTTGQQGRYSQYAPPPDEVIDIDSDDAPGEWEYSSTPEGNTGESGQPAGETTAPHGQQGATATGQGGDTAGSQKPPKENKSPPFDINNLSGENFDEFTNLFENFLEKEHITSPPPPTAGQTPPPQGVQSPPPQGQGAQNNQNPFGNMDISTVLSLFQAMNGANGNSSPGGNNRPNSGNFNGQSGNAANGNPAADTPQTFEQTGEGAEEKKRLLLALKPFLSPARVQKIEQGLKFIKLYNTLPASEQTTF